MISRRDLLAQLAMAGAVARAGIPPMLFAQAPTAAQRYGKDKLIVRSVRPPDFETPVALLDSFITPNDLFYVRSHMPVPAQLDAATWALKIGGEVNSPLSLSLDEIKKLPAVTVTVDARVRRQRPRVLRSGGRRHPVGEGRGRHRPVHRRAPVRRAEARRREDHRHATSRCTPPIVRSAPCRRSCARCRWPRRCTPTRSSPTT